MVDEPDEVDVTEDDTSPEYSCMQFLALRILKLCD